MVKVRIRNDDIVVDVPKGALVLDYVKNVSSIPYGCTQGKCKTCLCAIIRGAEELEPPTQSESDLLKRSLATPGQRLGCQLRIRRERDEEIEIEY